MSNEFVRSAEVPLVLTVFLLSIEVPAVTWPISTFCDCLWLGLNLWRPDHLTEVLDWFIHPVVDPKWPVGAVHPGLSTEEEILWSGNNCTNTWRKSRSPEGGALRAASKTLQTALKLSKKLYSQHITHDTNSFSKSSSSSSISSFFFPFFFYLSPGR